MRLAVLCQLPLTNMNLVQVFNRLRTAVGPRPAHPWEESSYLPALNAPRGSTDRAWLVQRLREELPPIIRALRAAPH